MEPDEITSPQGAVSETGIDRALPEWAALFNAGEYFAAHEVLEGPWLAAAEPEKRFLKGLIHAAVALYHYGRGNSHGARVKCGSCLRYLEPFPPLYRGVYVGELTERMERFFAPLLHQPRGVPPPLPAEPWPQVKMLDD